MSTLDRAVLAERTMTVERHFRRVAERLPHAAADLQPSTDASDASDTVTLRLWQATQIVIDLAMTACLSLKLGTPASYADAFRRLEQARIIDTLLADRLVRAVGSATLRRTPTRRSTCDASMRLRRTARPISWRSSRGCVTAHHRERRLQTRPWIQSTRLNLQSAI